MHPAHILAVLIPFVVLGSGLGVYFTPSLSDPVKKFTKKKYRKTKKSVRKQYESVYAKVEGGLDKLITHYETKNRLKREALESAAKAEAADKKRVDALNAFRDYNMKCMGCGHVPKACPCGETHSQNQMTWVPKLALVIHKCNVCGAEWGEEPVFNLRQWDLASMEEEQGKRVETEINRRMQQDFITGNLGKAPKVGEKVTGKVN